MGQWGLKGSRGGPSYEELIETEGRPRLRDLAEPDRQPTVSASSLWSTASGPCYSQGDELIVLRPGER
jgi:5-methyltetrahydrofolate--homocysteine methyltransferase